MCATANVHSVAAIQDFRAALAHFMGRARDAILSVELATRGTQEWLEHEQHDFWQREGRRRGEALVVAKTELARCKASKVFDHTPDCMDQKMAVRRAQAALEEAEEKVGLVRHWTQGLRHTVEEYKGRTQQLSNFLDGDLYQALTHLDRLLTSLESYAAVAPTPAVNTPIRTMSAREPSESATSSPAISAAPKPSGELDSESGKSADSEQVKASPPAVYGLTQTKPGPSLGAIDE